MLSRVVPPKRSPECGLPPSAVPPSIKAQGGAAVTALSVRAGSAVSLHCESNAIPAPVTTWYKNGRAIPASAALELLADGQTLHIKAAEVGQAGGRLRLPLLCHCQAISSLFSAVFYRGDVFPGGFSSREKHFDLAEAQVVNASKL